MTLTVEREAAPAIPLAHTRSGAFFVATFLIGWLPWALVALGNPGVCGSVLLVIATHAATNAFQGPWSAGLAILPEAQRGIDPHLLVMVPQVVVGLGLIAWTRGQLGLSTR